MSKPIEHMCPICQDKLDENRIFTPCIHGFHKNCLIQHLLVVEESENYFYDAERKIPCPICRNDINAIAAELRADQEYKNTSTGRQNINRASYSADELGRMFNLTVLDPLRRRIAANNLNTAATASTSTSTSTSTPAATPAMPNIVWSHTYFEEPRESNPININNIMQLLGNERLQSRQLLTQPFTSAQTPAQLPAQTPSQIQQTNITLIENLANFISSYNRYVPYFNSIRHNVGIEDVLNAANSANPANSANSANPANPANSANSANPVHTETLDEILSIIYADDLDNDNNSSNNFSDLD